MDIREDRKYLKSHQWVKEENGRALVGITDYAQESLQAVVFVNLPEEGETVTAGEPLGDVESVKVVADVTSPVSGVVCRTNEELMDNPATVNESPYDAWFIEVENVTGYGELLTPEEYRAFLETLEE